MQFLRVECYLHIIKYVMVCFADIQYVYLDSRYTQYLHVISTAYPLRREQRLCHVMSLTGAGSRCGRGVGCKAARGHARGKMTEWAPCTGDGDHD